MLSDQRLQSDTSMPFTSNQGANDLGDEARQQDGGEQLARKVRVDAKWPPAFGRCALAGRPGPVVVVDESVDNEFRLQTP